MEAPGDTHRAVTVLLELQPRFLASHLLWEFVPWCSAFLPLTGSWCLLWESCSALPVLQLSIAVEQPLQT